jgi:hypothetical protein
MIGRGSAIAQVKGVELHGKLAFAANISRSDPGTFAIIPLNLATSGETYNASYIHPMIRSRTQSLYLRSTFSAYNGKTGQWNTTNIVIYSIACAVIGTARPVVEEILRAADRAVEGADGVRIMDSATEFR